MALIHCTVTYIHECMYSVYIYTGNQENKKDEVHIWPFVWKTS